MNLNHLTGRHALGWLRAAQASGQEACDQSGSCLMLLTPCLVYDNSSWYQISSCPALRLRFTSDSAPGLPGALAGTIVSFIINSVPVHENDHAHSAQGASEALNSQAPGTAHGNAPGTSPGNAPGSTPGIAPGIAHGNALYHHQAPMSAGSAILSGMPLPQQNSQTAVGSAVGSIALENIYGPVFSAFMTDEPGYGRHMATDANITVQPVISNGTLQLPGCQDTDAESTNNYDQSQVISYIQTIRTLKEKLARAQSHSDGQQQVTAPAPAQAPAPGAPLQENDEAAAQTAADQAAAAAHAALERAGRELSQRTSELEQARARLKELEGRAAWYQQELNKLKSSAASTAHSTGVGAGTGVGSGAVAARAAAAATAPAAGSGSGAGAVYGAATGPACTDSRMRLIPSDSIREDDAFNDAQAIITRVCKTFAREGIELDRDDAANYLICLTQGMMTVFAGRSGSGKSTHCRLLAKALGLDAVNTMALPAAPYAQAAQAAPFAAAAPAVPAYQAAPAYPAAPACLAAPAADIPLTASRFVEVDVEAGWSSLKDFIAYFNPVSRQLEPVNSTLFEALGDLDAQHEHNRLHPRMAYHGQAPFVLMFDNADLSSMDHYFSAFFRGCDGLPLRLNFGGGRDLHMPESMRFCATVSQSPCHIPLSTRLLERSWVISLKVPLSDVRGSLRGQFKVIHRTPQHPDPVSDDDMPVAGTVSMEQLRRAFGPGNTPAFEKYSEVKWDDLLELFSQAELNMPLTARTIKMISGYCSAARRLMTGADSKNSLKALDYAVAQKILPAISGSGRRYEILLRSLSGECTPDFMPLCSAHIRRMADNNHSPLKFYSFFS